MSTRSLFPTTAKALLLGLAMGAVSSFAQAADQVVTPDPIDQTIANGGAVAIDANYNVSDGDDSLTGLGVRVHWDSTKLTFVDLSDVFPNDLLARDTSCQDDTGSDFDGDPNTNCYANVAWTNFGGNWPGTLPVKLYTANFTSQMGVGDSTSVNFSASSTAAGYGFASTSATVNGPLPPEVTLTPPAGSTHNFGDQTLNTTSSPLMVMLTNSGGEDLSVQGIATTGDFGETNNCPATLAPAASCTIDVTFTPTVLGARSGTLAVTSNAATSPDTLNLVGNGITAPPSPSFNPTSLTFGPLNVGQTSAAQSITLANGGPGALAINSLTTDLADYAISNNTCSGTLASGASCSLDISFSPAATGARNGNLTLSSNAPDLTAALTGTGTEPGLTVAPGTLSFGNQIVNTTSPAQTVTVSSSGSGPLTLASIGTSGGDYSETNTCSIGTPMAPGSSCTVGVTFTPSAVGASSATLDIASDAGSSPDQVALTGNGVAQAPIITLTPSVLSFGDQTVHTESASQQVTVDSTGNVPVDLTSINTTGDFGITSNNCPASLPNGASCTVSVNFGPTTPGVRSGALTVVSNAASSPDAVALNGNGVLPVVGVLPGSHDNSFRFTRSGNASNSLTVHYNTGGNAVPGQDYTPLPGAATFSSGSSEVTVDVNVLGADAIGKQLTLILTPSNDYNIDPANVDATISLTQAFPPILPEPAPAVSVWGLGLMLVVFSVLGIRGRARRR